MKRYQVAVARGDGIGPEIMEAVLAILKEAGSPLSYQEVEVGQKAYEAGVLNGISGKTWEIIRESRAFLKAPITTPQGKGFRSVNVSLRSGLELYANVRPIRSYPTLISTRHPPIDLVIVRENREDLYVGREYQHSSKICHAFKVITAPVCQRIIRYAFAYADHCGRKKVTCMTKDNILKLSDGMFHRIFTQIARENPQITSEHLIVDIGMAKVAAFPETFDLIVLPNLYGDILSDIAAQIAGSVGLAGSVNLGEQHAMFEAVHGSAPDLAGKGRANPSGLLFAAMLLLLYLGENSCAHRIYQAWYRTLEEGFCTDDLWQINQNREWVSTKQFTQHIIGNLGKNSREGRQIKPLSFYVGEKVQRPPSPLREEQREINGMDIYLFWERDSEEFLQKIIRVEHDSLALSSIYQRGVCLWPQKILTSHFATDLYLCRFLHKQNGQNGELSQEELISLLSLLTTRGFSVRKMESLSSFNGKIGYSQM